MIDALLPISLICVVAGLLLWALARAARRRGGLPQGEIRYSDTGEIQPPALFSQRLGLSGRPDYLVKRGRHLIPVEVKSGRAPARPYHGHLLQLIAYCLLVEDAYGRRPPYGIIRYADKTFRVQNEGKWRRDVLEMVDEMRRRLRESDAPAKLVDDRRCRRCNFRDACEH
jgi:CRISPR-associated exonuclease Cas4